MAQTNLIQSSSNKASAAKERQLEGRAFARISTPGPEPQSRIFRLTASPTKSFQGRHSITVTGAGSHAVKLRNINGLTINQVIARDVGECGLLTQATTNARVGLVDGDNVAAGNGYATFRMSNNNGQLPDGSYVKNIFVDRVVSRGGGRDIFCVSQSGGAEIGNIDLANNGNNAILIENCYGLSILGGSVNGGGEVRLAARSEFPNNRDISVTAQVDGPSVMEEPCGENINWYISGSAALRWCWVAPWLGSTQNP